MKPQTIHVSTGAAELTYPATLTEENGENITADPVRMSLGDYTDPGTVWLTPTVDTSPTPASRTVQLMIDDTFTPGSFYLWLQVADGPEQVQRRAHRLILV